MKGDNTQVKFVFTFTNYHALLLKLTIVRAYSQKQSVIHLQHGLKVEQEENEKRVDRGRLRA